MPVQREFKHIPVMLNECVEGLGLTKNSIFVDATLGGAGHSLEVGKLLGPHARLIGIDQDEFARKAATTKLSHLPRGKSPYVQVFSGNFGQLDSLLVAARVPGIDCILFDLGVSSVQIDEVSRGFSFKENAPLDMRMNPDSGIKDAAYIVNTYSESELTRIILKYSDEKWASRIAKFIVAARDESEISTSFELVEIIKAAIPASARRSGGHPAKRTFQALRIEVNAELDNLEMALDSAIRWLNPGGRIVVMSYHSLEDRMVKDIFAKSANRCTCPSDFPTCVCGKKPLLKLVTRKPVVPSSKEVETNPRSRSAKLRIAEKL